jgi:hypothetical protein
MKIHQILINDTNNPPDEFPEFHNICYEQIKKLYPDEEYHLYSGEELEGIIKNNFDDDVYVSYKKLRPYACKADLARLCLLYLYGGLYIDLNLYFINTIPDLDRLEFFAFRDLSKMSKQSWAVQNGIMYSTPKSKVVKNAIDLIVKHCKEEYYGVQCVDVSATTVLGIAITKSLPHFGIATNGELDSFTLKSFDKKTQNKIKKMGYKSDSLLGFIMDEDDKLIAIRKPSGGGDIEAVGFKGTNNYVKMWKDKEVYDNNIKFIEKPKNINYG